MKKAPHPKRETKLNSKEVIIKTYHHTYLNIYKMSNQWQNIHYFRVKTVSKQCQNSVKTVSKQCRFHTAHSSGQKYFKISILSLAEYPHKIVESASIASFLLRKYDL